MLDVPWANSLADVRRITRMLGDKLGAPDRAARIVEEMDAELAAARAMAPHPPVSALIYEPNGYATADRVSDEIMAAAGLSNSVNSLRATRLGTIPVEAVIAAAPQLLILNASREGGPALADAAIRHPALAALKGRSLIVRVSLTPLLCPGPWSAAAAGEFAKWPKRRPALRRARPRTKTCPASVPRDGRGEKGTRCGDPGFAGANSAAAPATVSGEPCTPSATGKPGRRGEASEPQARKPAVRASSIR